MTLRREEMEQLADPLWRFQNLYTIVTDEAQEVRFAPNAEQLHLMRNLHTRTLVLKARQLGFTTAISVAALDQVLFNANFAAVTIADSLPNAEKIFRNKVMRAYQALPELVRRLAPVVRETASELVLGNGSSLGVTTSARSGTVNFLHVSEMGKIARKYPEKAREIVTGSFEAVPRDGVIVVESTAEGRSGWFHDAVMLAHRRAQQREVETPLDWRLHFYPWLDKPSYAMDPTGVTVPEADRRYFEALEAKLGRKVSPAQRAWWVKKRATLGEDMLREYPATVEEAFEQSTDGLIYGKEMALLRSLGRIGHVQHRAGLPVNTFWDLGVNDTNCIWLHQRMGAMNRFVGYVWASNEGIGYYWRELEAWRVKHDARWGSHYLPHDADQRIQGFEVMTRRQILEEAGARNVVVVPRVQDVRTGIDQVRRVLPDCEFDAAGCADGLKCLDAYCRDWDDKRGAWSSHPRHDWASNGADALRQFAQAFVPASDSPRPALPPPRAMPAGY